MSANPTPRVTSQEQFQSDLSNEHLTALFNPVRAERTNALKRIRASAGLEPDEWKQLDLAAGITSNVEPDEARELIAEANMPYNAGTQFADDMLMEQFIQSTAVDEFIGMGMSASASLASYVYAEPLNTGRMSAEVDMNARAKAPDDGETFGLDGVPLPIVHCDYELDAHSMEVHSQYGEPLEARRATRAREALNRREVELLWNGWGGTHEVDSGSYTVGGLDVDDGGANIIQSSATGGWEGSANNILADAKKLHNDIEDQTDVQDTDDVPLVSSVGATVWVPNKLWGDVSRLNYEPSSGATDEPVIERLERKYPYMNWMPAPRLDSDSAIMVLNDPRYFSMVQAQSVTNTAEDIDNGYATKYKLISSRIPFVRRQPDGIRGIVRMTGVGA
jgi:hypothetical protein